MAQVQTHEEAGFGGAVHAGGRVHVEGQQHPIGIYLQIWGWLFVLSAGSYLVDYFNVEGYLRWSLILIFMLLKAGLIVSVFRSEEHTSELQSLMRISYAVFCLKKT